MLKCRACRGNNFYSEEKVSVIRNLLITAVARLSQEVTLLIPNNNTEDGESSDKEDDFEG